MCGTRLLLTRRSDGEIIDGTQLPTKSQTGFNWRKFQQHASRAGACERCTRLHLKDSMSSVSYLLPLGNRISNNRYHKALVVDDSAVVRRYVVQLLEHQYIQTIQAEDWRTS